MSMINEFVEEIKAKINHKKEYHKNFYEKLGQNLNDNDLHKTTQLAFDDCMEIVNKLAEEYKDVPDTNVGKWIPVSERLPDDFMSYEYLTIRKGQTLATITYYCVLNHKWYSNRKSTKEIDVIAWQPLPQLYKGE